MAGGEFRLGTVSIYMADYRHARIPLASELCPFTWLHFRWKIGGFYVIPMSWRKSPQEVQAKGHIAAGLLSVKAIAA